MSFIARRGLSTLIPPKVASPNAIGAAKDAARMSRITSFYEKLPRGPRPAEKPSNPLDMYRVAHFGDKPSAWPLYHALIFLVGIGYAQAYYFHLRHHKNNAH
ncbi:mitochondrial F1F0 ATP synthase-like protein subunit F [Microthyrium microscopicum]|uniref:Mitochondrial F1F0 ATP synthase-like protein subunit F n=1 Tax=Microthyrium microscopicum TaxID=703497 RepID=A0A6A6UK08_9PEZI|nr:mitochondrial F1F0 ATP synthase-like protein subunit F [Microthyrium microscopicum]